MQRFVLALCALLLLAAPLHAQTGMAPTDFDELQKIPAWQPEATGYAENFSVDLRDRLPPVGRQSMGDCAAWAFGYAGKSFLEANDQGWRPDQPGRTFSPTFIYNSLAKAEQAGLTPLQVLEFLRDKGCATLATAPYLERDFTSQPSPRAKSEAELFKISGFAILKDGPDLHAALQQGHVVQIGVRTNPIFNGGNYDIYNPELHTKGHAQRKPGQLHGFHALAVVGFDDTKQAFLIMNSWGTRWGQAGYCWVSYDVAKTFNSKVQNVDSGLIDWAIVMYDVKEKVDVGPDGIAVNAPLDKNSVTAVGRAEYRGFDPKLKKHVYFFNTTLAGQKKALDLVKSVAWTYPTSTGRTDSLTATSRITGFAINGGTIINEFSVTGTVTFTDGSSKDVVARYRTEPPQAENRSLKFKVVSRYWGKNNAGDPLWNYEIKPLLSPRDADDVVSATWDFSSIPNSREKQIVYGPETKSSPRYDAPQGLIFAAATVKARFNFNDGSAKDITLQIPTDDPIDDTYRLESQFQDDGPGADGRTVYSYQVRLRMPMKDYFAVDTVKWDLGPGVSQRSPHTHSYNDYTASGTSSRDFRARLSITRHDAGPMQFDKWIELGPSARFANPLKIDLGSAETYLGRTSGVPTWKLSLFPVGDVATTEKIQSVQYSLPEGYSDRSRTVTAAESPDFNLDLWAYRAVNVPAKVLFKDQSTTDVQITAAPVNLAHDGLSVFTWYDNQASKAWDGVSLRLAGPTWDLDRVREIDYRFERGGYADRKRTTYNNLLWPSQLSAGAQISPSTLVHAVVTYADGSQEWVSNPFNGEMSAGSPIDLRLQLRERFAGFEAGRAQYQLSANLAGQLPLIDKIQSVTYTFEAPDLSKSLRSSAGWNPIDVTVTGPAKVTAQVTFKPEFKLEPRTLPVAFSHATAPRTPTPLVLREMKQPWNTDTAPAWIVFLDGWESALKSIASVTYTLPKDIAPAPVVISDRAADSLAPFAYRGKSTGPADVQALITFKDGKTQTLTLQVGLPPKPDPKAPEPKRPEAYKLIYTESPVPNSPDIKEWTISLETPPIYEYHIAQVAYTQSLPGQPPKPLAQLKPEERWTDAEGDFAIRIYSKEKPAIQAQITFTKGKPPITVN